MNNYDFMNNKMINNNLTGLYSGFMRGIMFSNIYNQYRDYITMMINPSNEKEQFLLDLNQVQFAMHDINLYLDNYPNDNMMIKEFNKNRELYLQLLEEYENRYGAINISSNILNNNPWQWNNEPWPWEGSDN